jgi:phosphatidylglycerophosphatase GEP4
MVCPAIAIADVNYQALRDHCGIKAVIFDKDNTLTAPYENSLHPAARVGLQSALDTFGPANVAILSNSAGTDDDPQFDDGRAIEEALGIAVIRHSEKKPGGLAEVLRHFPHVDDPAQLCMAGDRLLTDIVFGNLHGMLTVHALPLCTGKENARDNTPSKIIRAVENKIMYANWWGARKIQSYTLDHKVWKGETECPLVLTNCIN